MFWYSFNINGFVPVIHILKGPIRFCCLKGDRNTVYGGLTEQNEQLAGGVVTNWYQSGIIDFCDITKG